MTDKYIMIQWAVMDWLLFSIALYGLAKKLGWKEKWKAWIPGPRFVIFSDAVSLNAQGTFCGILDVLFIACAIVSFLVPVMAKASVVLGLLFVVLLVFFFTSRIRIFLRYTVLFGVRKRWSSSG